MSDLTKQLEEARAKALVKAEETIAEQASLIKLLQASECQPFDAYYKTCEVHYGLLKREFESVKQFIVGQSVLIERLKEQRNAWITSSESDSDYTKAETIKTYDKELAVLLDVDYGSEAEFLKTFNLMYSPIADKLTSQKALLEKRDAQIKLLIEGIKALVDKVENYALAGCVECYSMHNAIDDWGLSGAVDLAKELIEKLEREEL